MDGVDELAIAQSFTSALDADDFEAAGRMLAADCVYVLGQGRYEGPEAILASYRRNSEKARALFDEVIFESFVDRLDETRFLARYVDHVRVADRWFSHHAHQTLQVSRTEGVFWIEDQEIPGEREKLSHFLAEVGRA